MGINYKDKCSEMCFMPNNKKRKEVEEQNDNEEAGTSKMKEELGKAKEGWEGFIEKKKE